MNAITKLEGKTCKYIGIAFSEHEALGKYNDQTSSPLFSVLPRELRDLIWALATAPYEDPNAKFEKTAYYYRPGHTARLRTEVALLLTCRRVWLEANALPMLQAEQSFYYFRGAPDGRDPEWMARLTKHNSQNLGELHLLIQMGTMEKLADPTWSLRDYFLKNRPVRGDLQPRVFRLTIRHTDWWSWENDAPLRLQDNWVKALLDAPELRSTPILKLDLETLDYKADQLAVIVDRIKMIESESRPSHYVGNSPTMTRFELVDKQDTSTWEGPTNIDDRVRHAYDGKATLTYHVVTLTWNLRFTELPHASVPGLRRASVSLSPDKDPFAVDKDWGRAEGELRFWYAAILPRRREPRMTEWTEGMKQHHFMLRFWTQVRWVSRRQAELGEAVRRRQFEELCGAAREREWAARWEAEKSLLKFIGHRVP
ncbi:hypothetical protein LTR91_019547 [Friedmanniomyces endolithicus]|uniref:Uncharacterized protein n=1 Tax=Friedmanniomyces endolithicus TaxID=329885 RepID=A0AAN6FPM0_9PEZI|nr:hypothetical protein LTS00_014565 [Friedmanniomyces endolithicus]KAK0277561.1 hypothetical protein LTR35_009963 [Friedmanniomyces endolithicus]KAK0319948.1 hypothetical protein LTR82_008883 [Friedmanniomyces endolithicus]KAK0919311.1 hypothetical protein LTR57_010879 [Friedmanniomyces endolithicus]KAK0962204.1 hypothetical protein LTR91_019547 [Friedmanniomyces endolithicus]